MSRSRPPAGEGSAAGWGVVLALSALLHFGAAFTLLPWIPSTPPPPTPTPPPEETPVAVLLDPDEPTDDAPAEELLAEALPAPVEAPPEPTPPPDEPLLPPQEPTPEEPPPPKPPQEPPPKEQISEANKIAVDVPLVPDESEPPPDTPYLGPQDRRVDREEQPRERSLTPSQVAPPSFDPPPVADSPRAADDTPETPPPPAEAPPTPDPPTPDPPEPAPPEPPAPAEPAPPTTPPEQAEQVAERTGAPGAAAEAEPTPAEAEGVQALDPRLDSPAERAGADTPADTAPQAPAPAPGERGTGGRFNLDAAIQIDPNRYDAIFSKRDQAARKREADRTDRFLGRWEKRARMMRASLENFTPRVRYGNQMLINTKRSVYATYLARVHQTIHRQWAFGYLRQLDLSYPMGHPLQNKDLNATIEFVIDARSGELRECNIVNTSGQLEYDAEAVRICLDSSPNTPAPPQIVSPDGHVYIHWNFWRDTRQCGTFGASIFVLDNDGKLDTWKVKESIDDLDKQTHPPGAHPHPAPEEPETPLP